MPTIFKVYTAHNFQGIGSQSFLMFVGAACRNPHHGNGVTGFCKLSLLELFDMILDICADLMHIVAGLFSTHLIPMMKGAKRAKAPCAPAEVHISKGEVIPYTKEEMVKRQAKYGHDVKVWADIITVH